MKLLRAALAASLWLNVLFIVVGSIQMFDAIEQSKKGIVCVRK